MPNQLQSCDNSNIVVANANALSVLSPQGTILSSYDGFSNIAAIGHHANDSNVLVVELIGNELIVKSVQATVCIHDSLYP